MAVGSQPANQTASKTEPFACLKIETDTQAQILISDVYVTHEDNSIRSIRFKLTNTSFPPICFVRLELLAPDMRRVCINGELPAVEDRGFFFGCLTWGTDPCNEASTLSPAVVQLLPHQSTTLTFDTRALPHFPSYSNALEFPPTISLILTRSCYGEVNVIRTKWNDKIPCHKLIEWAP